MRPEESPCLIDHVGMHKVVEMKARRQNMGEWEISPDLEV
jgi:hypothetical protein